MSAGAARDVYGVVLGDDREVDATATGEARLALRHRREAGAGLPPELAVTGTDVTGARWLDDNLAVVDSTVVCVHCGTPIGPLEGGAFVHSLACRETVPSEAGRTSGTTRRSTSTRRSSSGSCCVPAASRRSTHEWSRSATRFRTTTTAR